MMYTKLIVITLTFIINFLPLSSLHGLPSDGVIIQEERVEYSSTELFSFSRINQKDYLNRIVHHNDTSLWKTSAVTSLVSIVYVDDDFNSTTPGWGYDHFASLQTGIDAVDVAGIIYLFNGNYFENIVIQKSVTILGEDMDETVINGVGDFTLEGNIQLTLENLSFIRKGNIWVMMTCCLTMNNAKFFLRLESEQQYMIQIYGRIIINNTSLLSQNSYNFYVNVVGSASVNHIIMQKYSRFYGNGGCSIDVNNSKLGGIGIGNPEGEMIVRNSQILDLVDIDMLGTTDGYLRVNDLHPGFFPYWNLRSNLSSQNMNSGNITLINTNVYSWAVRPCGKNTTTIIENSDIGWIRCHYGERSFLQLKNVTINDRGWDFNKSSNITINTLGQIVITNPVSTINSSFFLYGDTNYTFLKYWEINQFIGSTVVRNYNISVKNSNGQPVENTLVRLYNPTGSIIWSGVTDHNGNATMYILFNVTNYNNKFTLRAVSHTLYGSSKISLFCDTPMVIVLSENTTLNPPHIQLLYPTGGEILNDTITVQWSASDYETGDNLPIYLFYSDEEDYWYQIDDILENDGAYQWNTSMLPDGLYKLHIETFDTSNNLGQNTSKWFVIQNNEEPPGNLPPDKPTLPAGVPKGTIGIAYNYSTATIDSDGDPVYYFWDWGDGITSGWLGPYPSGDLINTTYRWTVKGSYNITVKAKDIHGHESPWSDPLPITMPYTIKPPFQQFLDWLFQWFLYPFLFLRHLMGD